MPFQKLDFGIGVSTLLTSIEVEAGDIIGVIGYNDALGFTPLGNVVGPFETVIGNDVPFTLNPLRFNSNNESVFDSEDKEVFSDTTGQIGMIGMTYHLGSLAPVPEPETYAMLLAGLGLLGLAARRRKLKPVVA